MKKAGVFIFLVILLLAFISAQAPSDPVGTVGPPAPPNASGLNQNVDQARATGSKINQQAEDLIEREIDIPNTGAVGFAARFVFGIRENKVTMQFLVMLLMIWIIFLVFIIGIMKTFSMFSEAISFILGVAFMVILVNLGFIGPITQFFISAAGFLGPFGKSTIGQLIIGLIALIVIWGLLRSFLRWWRRKRQKEKAHEEGIKIGADLGFLAYLRKVFGSVSGVASYKVRKPIKTSGGSAWGSTTGAKSYDFKKEE
jgi:hypothetical protein